MLVGASGAWSARARGLDVANVMHGDFRMSMTPFVVEFSAIEVLLQVLIC